MFNSDVMKKNYQQNCCKRVGLVTAMLCLLCSAQAQKRKADSLAVLREYVKLWQMYQKPVQLSIRIQNSADPVSRATDTVATDVDYYLSSNAFYFQSEGMEQIVNDSLIIVVNHPVKQITIYRNEQPVKNSIQKSLNAFLPDSSIERLAKGYSSTMKAEGQNKNRIELQNRAVVYGTTFPKEKIEVLYKQNNYEPIELLQRKCSLVPIDSITYAALLKDQTYSGKLVSSPAGKGNAFFIVKELKTLYSFKKVQVNVPHPPVQQQDRISIDENGDYIPVNRYKEYLLSKEF